MEQVNAHNARVARGTRPAPGPPLTEGEAMAMLTSNRRESDLHKQILAECSRRNLVCFHGSTAHKTRRTPGEPDCVILLPGGRVLLVECKTKAGQRSEAQIDVFLRAHLLGHTVHLVRSFEDFHALLIAKLTHEHLSQMRGACPQAA